MGIHSKQGLDDPISLSWFDEQTGKVKHERILLKKRNKDENRIHSKSRAMSKRLNSLEVTKGLIIDEEFTTQTYFIEDNSNFP